MMIIPVKLNQSFQITLSHEVCEMLHLEKEEDVFFEITADGEVFLKNETSAFWKIVNDQAAIWGNVSTAEIDWGPDVGEEIISD